MRVPPYVALIPVCAGVFIAADDQTVIVTVLPEIMLDMKIPINELDRASWTVTGGHVPSSGVRVRHPVDVV